MLGPLLAMPSGQGLNMTLLAILKVNGANWLLVLEKNWSCGKMFLLLTRYHYWLDNIKMNILHIGHLCWWQWAARVPSPTWNLGKGNPTYVILMKQKTNETVGDGLIAFYPRIFQNSIRQDTAARRKPCAPCLGCRALDAAVRHQSYTPWMPWTQVDLVCWMLWSRETGWTWVNISCCCERLPNPRAISITLWLCQNSYWKWPLIVYFPIKNGDFQ